MQTNSTCPVAGILADAIKHMAAIIEKRATNNQLCFIHSNDHRIAVKDERDVVIVWVKISK
jgi:hypothetical protein